MGSSAVLMVLGYASTKWLQVVAGWETGRGQVLELQTNGKQM
jgi:hypothetical protein